MLLFSSNLELLSQAGKEFWFVAPEVTSDHNDRPIKLRISTYGDSAYVTVSQPANGAFATRYIGIPAGDTRSIDLTADIETIENYPPDTVLDYGLLIESTADIACYYEVNTSNNTDIFTLKGANALGMEFLVPAQTYWKSATKYSPDTYAAIDIVATQDNTSITISPTDTLVGHAANATFSILLNRGETYNLQAGSQAANHHLEGTALTSDKPVAVTISDDSVERSERGGCKDLIGDQLIPLEKLGTEYLVMKGFLNKNGYTSDKIYVLATEDSTDVFIDGAGTAVATLNKGEQYEHTLDDPTVYINTTENVYVMHVTGFGCEVGTAVLPSMYCTGSEEVAFTRSKDENFYMVVLTSAGLEDFFEVNGDPAYLQPSDFNAVAGTGGTYVAARKFFNPSDIQKDENYRVVNTKGNFHLGIINGGSSSGCMYGYFSDFGGIRTDPIFHQ